MERPEAVAAWLIVPHVIGAPATSAYVPGESGGRQAGMGLIVPRVIGAPVREGEREKVGGGEKVR